MPGGLGTTFVKLAYALCLARSQGLLHGRALTGAGPRDMFLKQCCRVDDDQEHRGMPSERNSL